MSHEKIKHPYKTNKSLSPKLVWYGSKIKLKFNGSCLKQDKATFNPKNVVNLFIFYELGTWSQDLSADFALKDCLFGSVKLAKNSDPNKYKYSSCCIGFDLKSIFSLRNFDWGKNAVIFAVDMSCSVHAHNKTKNVLVFGQSIKEGLDDTALTAGAKYSINFSRSNRNFV